jgi:serine/threonine protein kinase
MVPKTVCGKMNYIAPEVLNTDIRVIDPMLCDIWALGIILFICMTGLPPMDQAIPADERFRKVGF